jgi:hypothetical protein
MTKPNRRLLPLFVLLLVLWAACTPQRDLCLQPQIVYAHIGCHYIYTDTLGNESTRDSLLPNANIIAIDIDTAKGWIIGAKGANAFTLLLSPKQDSCIWLIQPDSAVSPIDTLIFQYQRNLQFLSNACGFTYYYNLKNINTTTHNIDSVIIANANVNNSPNIEHVKVYFHH